MVNTSCNIFYQIRKLFLAKMTLLFVLYAISVTAQPGWQDHTSRYFYKILDDAGNEISFNKSKIYQIEIAGKLYEAPNIPNDSVPFAIENVTDEFCNYFRINDLSLCLSKRNQVNKLEIKIISNKDTMYLNQPSGIGLSRFYPGVDTHKKLNEDYILQFIPGHYFFPRWMSKIKNDLPKGNGNVKIVNLDQRNFIIPKNLYNLLAITRSGRSDVVRRAEESVIDNFTKEHFMVKKTSVSPTANKSFHPYTNPYWDHNIYPTRDANIYVGVVTFKLETHQQRGGRGVAAIFDNNKNTIDYWSPIESSLYASTFKIYQDSFNEVFYNATILRDSTSCESIPYGCPFTTQYYRSENDGQSWKADDYFSFLFRQYAFRKFSFLDKNFAVGFTLRTVKHSKKNYTYQQGIYYLLKNKVVVDSLKTPIDLHYNSNYNRYAFSIKNDTIFLGPWSMDGFKTVGNPFYKPMIVQEENHWEFKVNEEIYKRTPPVIPDDSIIEYQNLIVVNKHELVFKNGLGSLLLNNSVTDDPMSNGIYILEKENQIYLLDYKTGFTYLSFDAGNSWYIYPKPLEERANYWFLEIDDTNTISFFDKRTMQKVFYNFSLKD